LKIFPLLNRRHTFASKSVHLYHSFTFPVSMLYGFISDLSTQTSLLLVLCLVAVCLFEAINGFHDTANAVATVIYTKTLPPMFAVVWSGIFNFLGAYMSAIGVAMGMLKLVPLETMMTIPLGENVALVLAILFTAIAWNLGTWYFGIPCSSSHTMIGSLLGGGLAFYAIQGGAGPNWEKAREIGMSLLLSPFVGFALAVGLMFLLRRVVKNKIIFKEPDSKKKPPTWIRAILIGTCTAVSYMHGNNDGQKGVGLLLVVLIAFMPMQFALNPALPVASLKTEMLRVEAALTAQAATDTHNAEELNVMAGKSRKLVAQMDTADLANRAELFTLRKGIKKFKEDVEKTKKEDLFSKDTKAAITPALGVLGSSYEFSPSWVILLISLCLGIGTMVGWKRIVVTIGEKIGKTHLTYAQGASAELVASITIGLSSYFKLPVSTTHVLSSGIAGSMVAEGGIKNLRKKTIINIALAWVLTLPVTFIGSALLYFLFRLFL
jgi:inorganic phosphate transporter, PiT family